MKKLLFLLLAGGFAFCNSFAKNADAFDSKFVFEDIETFKINKEEPRAFFISYPNFELAAKPISADDVGKIYDTPNYMLLNGDWKFLFLENEKLFKSEYVSANFDDAKWDTMDVPNTWQTKGYDRIFYNNTTAEFQFHKDGSWIKGYGDDGKENPSEAILNPVIPEEHREVAVYRRDFNLPENWNGRAVFIRFNGVRTGFKVFVNGKLAGYAEDSFTPSEFNITPLLKKGKNSVAVEVFKYSTGGFFEMQDMPHMSGIIRDVMLISRPETYIRDYYAPVFFSDDLSSAKIKLETFIKNLSEKSASGLVLKADIIDEQGNKLNSKTLLEKKIPQIQTSKEIKISADIGAKNFKLWSPDKPNLYAILITLSDAEGKTLETVRADFAFRKFEVRGTGIFLNNRPVLFKGVNRHDWSPDKGKTCEFKWQKRDVELMKRININAVRTSHYPNDDTFYMLCSRYGLMVLDECNQEQHGYRNTGALDFDKFIPASVDRMRNMVFRDRNIPCVMIFSVGNESAGRIVKGHGDMAKVVRDNAPLHYVHSEAEVWHKMNGEDKGFSDFASPMYGGVDRMNEYLRKIQKKVPFFFCEYAHAMGNSIGNLKGKWDLIRTNADCLHGGFIWDWVDQSLYLPREDGSGKLYLSDGRDWKTSPSAGNFCSNGIVRADRTFFAKYHEVGRVYQDIQVSRPNGENPKLIKISNEFFDTNLNEFDAKIVVECNGKQVFEKTLDAIDLPAGKSTEIELDIPEFGGGGEYFYSVVFTRKADTLFAKKGDKVSSTQFKLKGGEPLKEMKIANRGKIEVSKNGDAVLVKAGNYVYEFDAENAYLKSLKRGRDFIITSPVLFDISTAYIDNERRGEVAREWSGRNLGKLKHIKPSLKIEKQGLNAARITCSEILANNDGEGFANEFVYTILSDGTMQVVATCQKINETPRNLNVARIGLKMGLNSKLENVKYFGRGGFANYEDRKEAADVGLYSLKVKDFMEDYSLPQDTGNREEVRQMKVTDENGQGVILSAGEKPLPMAILPYTQEELLSAKHPHNLKEPTQNELRIAWRVRGLGNNACGPSTRNQFKPDFKGAVSWTFVLKPVSSKAQKADGIFPKQYSYKPLENAENLLVEELMPKPLGRWVSENAKVSYSSIDEKWSPKKDNLMSSGDGVFSFHTLKERNPHLTVELERAEEIVSVEIVNRADAQGDRTTHLRMFVSENGRDWKRVWSCEDYKSKWIVNFENPIRAKYVRLMLDKTEIFHLKRLRIFAK